MNLRAGILLVGGGLAAGVAALFAFRDREREVKDMPPDEMPPPPGHTGYKRIDAIFGKLQAAAQSSGIPLGLLIGWIAKESGGKLAVYPQPGPGDTSMDERGYFQLTPEESKKLGLDHQRLSIDPDYSIDAGIKLIRKYQSTVNELGVPAGTSYYWRLVKLVHSMGVGQAPKIFKAAQAAGAAGSWDDLAQFALGMKINGPQPKKWFPFVDDTNAPTKDSSVYRIGRPFGFGAEAVAPMATVGAVPADDDAETIPSGDGLDCFGVDEEA